MPFPQIAVPSSHRTASLSWLSNRARTAALGTAILIQAVVALVPDPIYVWMKSIHVLTRDSRGRGGGGSANA